MRHSGSANHSLICRQYSRMSRIASNLGGMIDAMWGKMMLQALPKKVAVPGNTWHILAPVQIASPDCCRLPENLFERLFESFHIVSHCLIPSNPSSFPPFPALRLAPPCLYTRCIDPQIQCAAGRRQCLEMLFGLVPEDPGHHGSLSQRHASDQQPSHCGKHGCSMWVQDGHQFDL